MQWRLEWLRLERKCRDTQCWVLVAVRRRRIWIDSHVREPATLARQCLATLGLSVAFSTVKGRATLTLSVKLSVSNFFQCSLQRWWPCCARIWLCNSIAHVRCLQPMCLLFWFDFCHLNLPILQYFIRFCYSSYRFSKNEGIFTEYYLVRIHGFNSFKFLAEHSFILNESVCKITES